MPNHTPEQLAAAKHYYDVVLSGRTRYEGQEPRHDEVILAELARLEAIVEKLPKTADGVAVVPVRVDGDWVFMDLWLLDARIGMPYFADLLWSVRAAYSTRAAALAAVTRAREANEERKSLIEESGLSPDELP